MHHSPLWTQLQLDHMSEHSRKHKRRLQDSTKDLSKTWMAPTIVSKPSKTGIDETEKVLHTIPDHVLQSWKAFQEIRKRCVSCSLRHILQLTILQRFSRTSPYKISKRLNCVSCFKPAKLAKSNASAVIGGLHTNKNDLCMR